MMSVRNALIASVCALGVGFGSMPAEAASPSAPATASSGQNTIAGIRMDQIQKVDRRGGWRGGGGGHRGWGGGGRHYGGGWGGGRRHFGGGGWGGGRYYGGGRRYYGGGYGYRRHRGYGGYAAAGVFGLAAGALIANNYGYYDRPYYRSRYYDDGYYGRSYGGAECQVITKRRGYDGRLYRVTRYRPC